MENKQFLSSNTSLDKLQEIGYNISPSKSNQFKMFQPDVLNLISKYESNLHKHIKKHFIWSPSYKFDIYLCEIMWTHKSMHKVRAVIELGDI